MFRYSLGIFFALEEAFIGQTGGTATFECQLVGFLIDGLPHDYLKMKVMRENPNTLQPAITSPMNGQGLRKRFNLRVGKIDSLRHEGPMQIDHLRPSRHGFKCNQTGHLAIDCPKFPRQSINAVENYATRTGARGHPRPNTGSRFQKRQPQNKAEITCQHCGHKVHYLR